MKRFSEMNLTLVGTIGTLWTVLVLYLALNVGAIVAAVEGGGYSAAFSEASGLESGDKVRVSGVTVGKVTSVELDGTHVTVEFTANGIGLGSQTTAAVKTESGLGSKYLDLTPRGSGSMKAGAEIPLDRTQPSYDMTEVLADVTTTTEEIDTDRLATALDSLSNTFADTPKSLRDTLTGVRRLSQSIADRDEALRGVLTHANGVSGVLAERNKDIVAVLTGGNALLEELEVRKETLRQLLIGVRRLTRQLSGLVDDNEDTLRPALTELRRSLKVINAHADDLDASLQLLSGFGRGLMEAVGGGPFFYGYIVNLAPTSVVLNMPGLFDLGGAAP